MTTPGDRGTEDRVAAPTIGGASGRAAAEALDRLPDGVLSLDASLRVLFANLAAGPITGLDRNDLAGVSARDLLTAGYGAALERHSQDALRLQQRVTAELELSDGGARAHSFDPSPTGVTVTMELLPSSATPVGPPHYCEMLDDIEQGVVETAAGGEILFVNHAFATILGYDSTADLLARARTTQELYARPSERPADVRTVLDRDDETDALVVVELLRKDGSSLWVRARVTPHLSATGELLSIHGVLEGIAEPVLTQLALIEVADSIESRMGLLLAEVIHDEPLQLLAAALLRLDSLEGQLPGAAAAVVDQVVPVLEHTMDRLRRIMVTLHPPGLDAGLGAALLAFAQGIFPGDETTIDLREAADIPIAEAIRVAAYRILREALINVRKHAHASHVLIASEIRADTVVFMVEDDGVGGDFTVTEGHVGLQTMRARALALSATLTITTQPGGGTLVSLEIPRQAHA